MLKTEVNTLVKKGIQSTMILKKRPGFFENQNNFLTLKLSTVQFEYYTTLRCIFHLHISQNIFCLSHQNFFISIIFNSPWDDSNMQKKY